MSMTEDRLAQIIEDNSTVVGHTPPSTGVSTDNMVDIEIGIELGLDDDEISSQEFKKQVEDLSRYAEDVDMGYRMKLLKEKHYCVREAMFQHIMAVTISNGGQDIFKQSQNNAIKYHIQKWGGLPRQEKFLTPFNKGGDINYWKK